MSLQDLLGGCRPEGTKSFPLYRMTSVEKGKIFAEASMGLLGSVEYALSGSELSVKTSIQKPVLATLGCQLAGWAINGAMVSGPVRMLAKKPPFIFDKLRLEDVRLPRAACVEGELDYTRLINEFMENGIQAADILVTAEDSPAQFINIPTRAAEIVIFRMFHIHDLNALDIKKATSTCRVDMGKRGNMTSYLNDCIRLRGEVTLEGDFGGFRDFERIVTKNSRLANEGFNTILEEAGGAIHNVPLEAFSVSKLTIVDTKRNKTRAF